MMRLLAIAGVVLAFVTVASLVLANDGMTACQMQRSFDVCHATIY